MPGRQMSIDADLRAGLATKDDVLRRRDNVQRESQLYGALDGAMKFVKGDALAGLIFVLVNILGGIAVGVLQQGLSVEEAVRTYTILTIGDGLVTQLPSLLTSITAGFIVTRVRATNGADSIGEQIVDELRAQPRSLMATALLLSLLCFVPGLPSIVFGILALVVGGTGIYSLWSGPRLQNSRVSTAGAGSVALAPAAGGQKLLPTAATPDMLPEDIKFLPVTPILINHNFGEFAARPADGRRLLQEYFLRVYLEQGIPLPAPMTRHDPSLEPGQVVVLVHECVVGRFVIPEGQVMVPMSPIMLRRFGISANVTVGVLGRNSWVAEDLAPQLAAANIPTIPHLEAFAGHVTTLITQSGADFLGIQELREILSKVEQDSPELVKEALKATPLPRMADIIQRLVSERVSVRDMRSILSGFVEWGPREKDPLQLAEHLRGVLRRQICSRLANGQPIIPVHICSAPLERIIRDAIRQTPSGTFLNLSQSEMERVMAGFRESLGDIASRSVLPIVLCSPDIRRFVRKLIERDFADVMVMAFPEMIPELKMQPIGEIMLAD